MAPSVAVIGDLLLDVIAHVTAFSAQRAISLKSIQAPVSLRPGGTGVVFALSAKSVGFDPVWLLGTVGADQSNTPNRADPAGQIILQGLRQSGVEPIVEFNRKEGTGAVMILHLSDDQRILIADKGANVSFGIDKLSEKVKQVLKNAQLLFVSGYSLLNSEQAKAVIHMMDISRSHGHLVILDLVPHTTFANLKPEIYEQYTRSADILVSETNTLRRIFLSELTSTTEKFSEEQVYQMADQMLKRHKAAILRLDNDHQYFFDRKGLIEKRETGYGQAAIEERTGFLDRLTAKELFLHYSRLA